MSNNPLSMLRNLVRDYHTLKDETYKGVIGEEADKVFQYHVMSYAIKTPTDIPTSSIAWKLTAYDSAGEDATRATVALSMVTNLIAYEVAKNDGAPGLQDIIKQVCWRYFDD